MTPRNVWIGDGSRFTSLMLSLLIAISLLVGAMEATATTVLWAPVDVLAERSSLIVQGTIHSKKVITTDEGVGVYTEYRIQIDEVMKGEGRHEAIVRIPGGQSGERYLEFHGAPILEAGSEYVLMLEPVSPEAYGESSGDYFIPIGLGQGVWRIIRREAGVEVVQQTGDITLVSNTSTPPTSAATMTLTDFSEMVSGGQP